jgi:predicted lipoprotein with Yx(FWY)xxD motif
MSHDLPRSWISGVLLVVAVLLAACGSSPATSATAVALATAGQPVAPAAVATLSPRASPAPTATFPSVPQTLVIQWERNTRLGAILTNPEGRTVYTYKNDKPGQSTCTGDCAKTWPPITIAKGWQPWAGPSVPGTVSVITRPDGTVQVAYNGAPLYLYAGDKSTGNTNGQGIDNLWYAVPVPLVPTVPPRG